MYHLHSSRYLLALFLAMVLAVVPVTAAFAESPQTITASVNLTMPLVNKAALGTLVLTETGTADQIVENWTFTGQVDGRPASVAGVNRGHWTGSGFIGQVTEITQWNVPGISRPRLPLSMALSSEKGSTSHSLVLWDRDTTQPRPSADQSGVVNLTVTTHQRGTVSIPIAVQGASGLPAPFQGNLVLGLTNASSAGPVKVLPRTGAIPEGYNLAALALIALGGGALLTSRKALRSRQPA